MCLMKMNFKNLEIEDKEWVEKTLSGAINSEAIFGTHFIWSRAFGSKICNYKGIFLKKSERNGICYEFPHGASSEEAFKDAVKFIFEDSCEEGYPHLRFTELLNSEVQSLEELFPGRFEIIPKREKYEYLYSVEDLAFLRGKKFHKKKNHVSKFSKIYNWKYTEIDNFDSDEYMKFFELWFKEKCKKRSCDQIPEYNAIKLAVENYKKLGLLGGKIEVDGHIIACTIGEKINNKIFLIDFEKALTDYDGAYSVINNEFAKSLYKRNYKLVNREEDLGIPGLRKSKLSYKPVFLVPKYEAVLKDFENGIA